MATKSSNDGGSRLHWLLFGSLVLNLFFVGAAGAVAIRYSGPTPLATISRIDRSMSARLDRLAAQLPPQDAKLLRIELRNKAETIATAQADLDLTQENVRQALRAQPFDAAAMRAAMAENRSARDQFGQVLQETIASAAGKMSVAGRATLADWRVVRDRAAAAR